VSRVTLWRWIKSGNIKAYQNPSGHYRLKREDLKDFIEQSLSYLEFAPAENLNKILIIDDDSSFRKLIRRILEKDAYIVEEAKNGFDAGLKVMKFYPSIIILDLFMPGMDGFQICRQLKSDQHTSGIKIIAVTGQATPEVEKRIRNLGADEYLEKPISANDLRHFLRQMEI
jgi:excisionase family DNA binding protein